MLAPYFKAGSILINEPHILVVSGTQIGYNKFIGSDAVVVLTRWTSGSQPV